MKPSIITLSWVVLAGCSAFETKPELPELVPLDVGNEWVYLDATNFVQTGTVTYRVEQRVSAGLRDAVLLAIIERDLDGKVRAERMALAYNEVGLNLHTGSQSADPLLEYFRFPLAQEERFLDPQGKEVCHAEAGGVQMPAGTFEVLIFGRCEDFDAHRTMFSPGVGMIYSGNSSERALFLSSYALNSAR